MANIFERANDCPVVLVPGLFGWGRGELADFPYWGTGLTVPSPLRRRQARPGPISSMLDRACELAFQIRGGQVDYGEAHAEEAGHLRYGKTYAPGDALYPAWSEEQPVHLVGHSMGGPTIQLLQQLLAEDYFGWGTTQRWVASISSISGDLNGSTLTYFVGCDEVTGLVQEDGLASNLGRAVELFLRATGSLFDRIYDFDLDQWGLGGMRDGEGLDGYLQRIASSPMFRGKDNGFYSLTLQNMLVQDARCLTYPDTYYFTYVTEKTVTGFLTGHAYPEPDMNPFLIAGSVYMGSKQFDHPFYPGFRSEDWWPNDGAAPVFSQQYPRIAGNHPVGGPLDDGAGFHPGAWYYQPLADTDHLAIVALPPLSQIGRQKRFYRSLFERLASLDIHRPGD